MKRLLHCSLIIGVLAAGLAVGSRPPAAANSATTVMPPSPLPSLMTGTAQFEVSARVPAKDELPSTLRRDIAADRDPAFTMLRLDLITRDPVRVGRLVLAWEPGPQRDELLRQFIRRWAETDLGGVIVWVTSLPDETDRQNAARAVMAQVAQVDPAGAIELAQLFQTDLHDGSLEHRMQLWIEDSPREALDWIVRHPAGPLRDRLLARSAHVLAQRAPAVAAGLVLDYMTPGDTRDEAFLGVVHQWAVRDFAWVTSLPDETD